MTEIDLLERKFDAEIAQHALALTQGRCKDFGEYQRICGVIYGLDLAKRELQDLRKKLESDDDD